MGYDADASFVIEAPTEARLKTLESRLKAENPFDVSFYQTDLHLWGETDARSFSEDDIADWLEPIFDDFPDCSVRIDYDCEYSESVETFFLGQHAEARAALRKLYRLRNSLAELDGPDLDVMAVDEATEAQIHTLHQTITALCAKNQHLL